jgi:hypothetical protein
MMVPLASISVMLPALLFALSSRSPRSLRWAKIGRNR